MALRPGTRLGPYEVIASVGEGGMGEVYRARDTRLGRDVALKVLPDTLVDDPNRLHRFEQEARAAGRLNHPNVLAIYDTGAHDGLPYVVSELLEGETLRERLVRGPVLVRKAVDYAIQTVRGLAAAHRRGIVHRDLKPENLFLTADGLVKILDFGLARLTPPTEANAAETGASTVTKATEPGTVLGTPAYMSPEQVRGHPADHRADIFGFGTVFYEMLSGKRPFERETTVETLSAILNAEPGELPVATLPPGLERVVRRCLEKNPDDRFQSASDLAFDLEGLAGSTAGATAPAAAGSRGRALPILALITLAAAAGWLGSRWGRATPERRELTLTRLTSDPGLSTDPALSADGKLLAYASDRAGEGNLDIWVRQVGGGEPLRLTRDASDDGEPHFSPDGRSIAFRSERDGGGIYVMSALGGDERRIADRGRRPRFSPDGQWIAYWTGDTGADFSRTGGSKTYVVGATGGAPRQIQPGFAATRYPAWSPDGKLLLMIGVPDWNAPQVGLDWWTVPWPEGEARKTGACSALVSRSLSCYSAPGAWIAPDRVLFAALSGAGPQLSAGTADATNIWQVTVRPTTGQVADAPERLTSGTTVEVLPSAASDVSVNPRWVFASLSRNVDLWSQSLSAGGGSFPETAGELQRLTEDVAPDVQPALSADGRRLVFTSRRWGNWDVWMKDLATGKESPLTVSPRDESHAAISRDGMKVAYTEGEQTQQSTLYALSVDAKGHAGPVERVCDGCFIPWDWSPDATRLLYWSGQQRRIGLIDPASGTKRDILQHPEHALLRSHYSPDGRWIAFHCLVAAGAVPVLLASVDDGKAADPEQWVTLLEGKTREIASRWSLDGKLLYFTSERDGFRCLWAQRLDSVTKHPAGTAFAIYHFHNARRSLMDIPVQWLEMGVAADKIVLPLSERTGNIWMASY